MQFSDLQAESRWITKTDSTTYPDTNLNRNINIALGELIQDIVRVQTTRNSTANNIKFNLISTNGLAEGSVGYNGEYPFPSDFIRPIRVEVSFDGDTWRPCSFYDINANTRSEYDQTDVNNTFLQNDNISVIPSTVTPFLRFMRDSFFIRPLNTDSTVTNGLIIWYEQRQSDLSNATDVPPFENNFHELIPLKVAMGYARRYPEKNNPLWAQEYQKLHADFLEMYRNRFKANMKLKPNYERFA